MRIGCAGSSLSPKRFATYPTARCGCHTSSLFRSFAAELSDLLNLSIPPFKPFYLPRRHFPGSLDFRRFEWLVCSGFGVCEFGDFFPTTFLFSINGFIYSHVSALPGRFPPLSFFFFASSSSDVLFRFLCRPELWILQ